MNQSVFAQEYLQAEQQAESSGVIAQRIQALVQKLNSHRAEEARLLQLADDQKRLADAIERGDLPELLREGGITELKLEDGTKVALKESVHANITEKNRAAALAWLIEHGFGGLIKTSVTVNFSADEHDAAEQVYGELAADREGAVEMKESVHANTLKAFVAEQLGQGNEVPQDLFGVFVYSVAKVTPPR